MARTSHQSKTKLLDAALNVFRAQGYTATTVDDICREAGVTKGSFFHHFKGKEELAIEATEHWSTVTGGLFASAPYRQVADPRERVLAYLDFRTAILCGELPEFTCLLGTMVQETFETHPALREACKKGIDVHAKEVAADIELAKNSYAPNAEWSAESLAFYTQATIQGAFILAKANGGPEVALQCLAHLRRYVEFLLSDASASPLSVTRYPASGSNAP